MLPIQMFKVCPTSLKHVIDDSNFLLVFFCSVQNDCLVA